MTESSSKRILLVDDDPGIGTFLGAVLKREGFDVVVASSGQAGLDLWQTALNQATPFALVITDLGMPDVDGHRIAAAVKTTDAATPVILLTGWGQWFEANHKLPPNVDAILNKPVQLQALREALAKCLRPAGA